MKVNSLVSVLLVGSLAVFSLSTKPIEELDQFIENARIQRKVPGVAVAIVKDDQVIFAKGYGVCRYDQTEKVDVDTIFQLASVSKTFASAGLGIQVDQKKLEWDDEIIKHLPQFTLKDLYATRYATSRDLLAHRTGLPAFKGDLLSKLGFSSDEILYRIRSIEPASSFRNKAFYSNIGFFTAGKLLEHLSGRSWEETIQKTLLDPLKMTRSGFSENLENSNVAFSHADVNGMIQVIPRDKSILFVAAGGVTSTAKDMGNWMIMHLNEGFFDGKQLLKPETIKDMHMPSMVAEVSFTELPPINDGSSFSFGLGWDNYQYQGKFIVEKGGALDGVRTIVTLIPELKMGITVMANLNLTTLPELVRAKFLDSFLGKNDKDYVKDFIKYEQEIAAIVQLPQKPKDAQPFIYPLSQCTGSFTNDLYGTLDVSHMNNELTITIGPAKLTGKLLPWSNNTFLLKWPTINMGHEFVTFVFGPDGKAQELQTETLGAFKRIHQNRQEV